MPADARGNAGVCRGNESGAGAGVFKGQGIRLCPQALGWRDEDAYVLGLLVQPKAEPVVNRVGRRVEWRWIRLADLAILFLRRGDWVTRPRAERQRPSGFLTEVYVEAE